MIFKRPPHLSITDLCIYVDENVYKENKDEQLIYEYIYHIVNSLAINKKLFNDYHYYEDFALFSANRIYLRLTNPKQFQLNADGKPKLKPIKSVLNFIKAVLYPFKVDFEQSEYCQCYNQNPKETEIFINYNFNNLLNISTDPMLKPFFSSVLNSVDKLCKDFLNKIPYKKDSSTWMNIYFSIMLSLCKQFKLTESHKQYIQKLINCKRLTDNHLEEIFNRLEEKNIVLFHLDESYRDYITVLLKEFKRVLNKELQECLQINSETSIQLIDLIIASFKNEVENDYTNESIQSIKR